MTGTIPDFTTLTDEEIAAGDFTHTTGEGVSVTTGLHGGELPSLFISVGYSSEDVTGAQCRCSMPLSADVARKLAETLVRAADALDSKAA
jgi:hypothetical protein